MGTVVVIVALAAVAISRMTPMYDSVGRITINRENADTLGFKDTASNTAEDFDYNVSLDTQVEVLESDTLALEVIHALKLDKDPRFLAHRGAPAAPQAPQALSQAAEGSPPEVHLLPAFRDRRTITKKPHTRVIEIKFSSPDPRLSSAVVSSLISNYIEHNFKTKYESTMHTSEFLSQQLVDLQMKVEESQAKLVKYQQESGILGLDEKQNVVTVKLNDLNQQLTAAQGDRIQKEANHQLALSGNPELIPAVSDSKVIDHLKEQESDLESQLAQLSGQLGSAHPRVIALRNQIRQVRESIHAESNKLAGRMTNEYRAAVQREKMLQSAFQSQKGEASRLNQSSIQYEILKHEAESNRQLYEGLLQKMKEASVSAGLRSGNIQVVDVPRPAERPSKPNIPLYLGLAFLGSLTLGTAAAFFMERLDTTVNSPDDIQMASGLTALGMIPYNRNLEILGNGNRKSRPGKSLSIITNEQKNAEVGVHSRPQSKFAESYRALRTSLLLSMPDIPPQVILVTSALPQDGKTSVSANMALTLAQNGGRVLLVDADMRRPRLHETLGMSASSTGLSTLLAGGFGAILWQPRVEHTLQDMVIVPSPQLPNLFVLLAGSVPPHPAELLSSMAMKELLKKWRNEYDHIVIDSPPILYATDGVILSPLVDSIILVVRSKRTTKQALRNARDILAQVNANVSGVVLNSVDLDQPGNYYYGKNNHGYYTEPD